MRWRREAEGLLEAVAIGKVNGLLYAQSVASPRGGSRTELVWLDSSTGKRLAAAPLEHPPGKQPQLGLLLTQAERVWGFFTDDPQKNRLEIAELIAAGAPLVNRQTDTALNPWTEGVDARLRRDVSMRLPGWNLVASLNHDDSGLLRRGGDNDYVVATLASQAAPTRLLRQVTLPDEPCSLSIQVDFDQGIPWLLEIRAGNELLLQETVGAKGEGASAFRREVNLSSHAGKTVWLSVVQSTLNRPGGKKDAKAYWRQLRVTPLDD